jgi:hypothetical protein
MSVVVGQNSPVTDSPAGVPLIGYENRVTSANLSSTTALTGFPVTNLANPATHLLWKRRRQHRQRKYRDQRECGNADRHVAVAGNCSIGVPITITDSGSPRSHFALVDLRHRRSTDDFSFAPALIADHDQSRSVSLITDRRHAASGRDLSRQAF